MTGNPTSQLETVCSDHGTDLPAMERLMGQPLTGELSAQTKRAVWELIRSPEFRGKVATALIKVRAHFPRAKIERIGRIA